MWKILSDINDLIKEEPVKQTVNLEELQRAVNKRKRKDVFRDAIYRYLKKYNKPISLLTREDIAIMTEWMDALMRNEFMDQVKYCLETNYWKPIAWIKANNKSLLFNK